MRDNYLNQSTVVPTVFFLEILLSSIKDGLSHVLMTRNTLTKNNPKGEKWAWKKYEWSQSCLFVSPLLVITMETNLNLKAVWSIFRHSLLTKFLLYRFKLFWKQNWGRCGPMFDRFSAVDKIKKVRCYIPFTHIIIRPWKGV